MVEYNIYAEDALCDNKPVPKAFKYRNTKYTDILVHLLGEEREKKIDEFLKDL